MCKNHGTNIVNNNVILWLKFLVGDKVHLVFFGIDSGIEYYLAMTRCWFDLVVNCGLWDIMPCLLQLSELVSNIAGSLFCTSFLLFPHRFSDVQVWWVPWSVETSDSTMGHHCCTLGEGWFEYIEVDMIDVGVCNTFHMVRGTHSCGREASQPQKWFSFMLGSW